MNNAIGYANYGCDPYYNMAVDEFLFQQAMDKPSVIFLRLYTWNEGAITFGYNQNINKAVIHDKLGTTPLIRRVTGGRALFHDPSELTYSIIVNTDRLESKKLTGSIQKTSQSISEALIDFLGELKLSSHYVRHSADALRGPKFFHTAPCFNSSSKFEIETDGKKIIASAQRRIGEILLQHGAVKINGIKNHPALNLNIDQNGSDLKILSSNNFNTLQTIFFNSMAKNLGFKVVKKVFSPSEAELIKSFSINLKKNSINKRNIVKQ